MSNELLLVIILISYIFIAIISYIIMPILYKFLDFDYPNKDSSDIDIPAMLSLYWPFLIILFICIKLRRLALRVDSYVKIKHSIPDSKVEITKFNNNSAQDQNNILYRQSSCNACGQKINPK